MTDIYIINKEGTVNLNLFEKKRELTGFSTPKIKQNSKDKFIKVNDKKNHVQVGPGKPRPVPDLDYKESIIPNICFINEYPTAAPISESKIGDKSVKVECTAKRIPELKTGEEVILKGYNFVDANAKVHITFAENETLAKEVNVQVTGDLITPLIEMIDGKERTIADCRVCDIISFKIPIDLQSGIYSIKVLIENKTGVGTPGRHASNEHYIKILE